MTRRTVKRRGLWETEKLTADFGPNHPAPDLSSISEALQEWSLDRRIEESKAAALQALGTLKVHAPTHPYPIKRIRQACGDESLEYLAVSILRKADALERALANGNAEWCAQAAWDVGYMRLQLDLVMTDVEDDAVNHREHREASGRRGTPLNPDHEVWLKENELKIQRGVESERKRATQIAAKHNANFNTVRAVLRRKKWMRHPRSSTA